MEQRSQILTLFILFWLGVLTGAVAAIMYMQAMSTSELKTDLLYTPIQYSVPENFKPGPDPWVPFNLFLSR